MCRPLPRLCPLTGCGVYSRKRSKVMGTTPHHRWEERPCPLSVGLRTTGKTGYGPACESTKLLPNLSHGQVRPPHPLTAVRGVASEKDSPRARCHLCYRDHSALSRQLARA